MLEIFIETLYSVKTWIGHFFSVKYHILKVLANSSQTSWKDFFFFLRKKLSHLEFFYIPAKQLFFGKVLYPYKCHYLNNKSHYSKSQNTGSEAAVQKQKEKKLFSAKGMAFSCWDTLCLASDEYIENKEYGVNDYYKENG